MVHPSWEDWKELDDEYAGTFWIAYWKGIGSMGQPIAVPCVYSEKDIRNLTPAGVDRLKDNLREHGLESWYDADEYARYNVGLFVDDEQDGE